jgi:hypothetical protein
MPPFMRVAASCPSAPGLTPSADDSTRGGRTRTKSPFSPKFIITVTSGPRSDPSRGGLSLAGAFLYMYEHRAANAGVVRAFAGARSVSSVNRDHRSRARGYGQRSAGLSDVGECAPPLSISMFSASASGGLSLPSVGDASPTPCVFRSSASGRFRAGFFFALGAATTEREEGTRFISPLNCANSASRRALSSLLPMRTQFLCETPNRVRPDSRQGAL